MQKSSLWGTVSACVFSLGFIASANAASFIPMGDIPDHFESDGYGVSADGTVAVGHAATTIPGTNELDHWPFRWTLKDGMVNLGLLSDTSTYASAVQTSADGSVITGTNTYANGDREAFRWTATTGIEGLGTLPGEDRPRSEATDITSDGSVIVGRLTGIGTFGSFIWTTADGMMQIGGEIHVNAISGNASYLVGEKFGIGSGAYLWTQDGGVITSEVFLGPGFAHDVSSDGSVVVGLAPIGVNDLFEGFRWTLEDGMTSLGTFGGEPGSDALGVSADGSVVVGVGRNADDEDVAFIWDETNGIQSLQDVLTGLGVNLDGWDLQYAFDVSADGSVIVGYGDNPDGIREAWIVNLTPIPIPPAFFLFGSGLVGLIGIARRKKSI